MSKLFVGFLNSAQLAALHAAGHILADAGLSEGQKLVATLKSTSIGQVVTNDIAALKDQNLSGAEKFAKVLANTAPLVLSYATGNGLTSLVGDGIGIAQELVQSLYNDTLGAAKAALAVAAPAA